MRTLCALLCLFMAMPGSGLCRDLVPASGTVEVLFTPWDDAEGALLKAIAEAHHEIYIQAYVLTSRPLLRTLLEAKRRGVAIEVLADHDMTMKSDGGSQIPALAAAGIPVFLEVRYAAAHNKIILVDPQEMGSVVLTGSYNYTYSAQSRNAENLLIIRSNAELARAYWRNWQRHRAEAVALARTIDTLH